MPLSVCVCERHEAVSNAGMTGDGEGCVEGGKECADAVCVCVCVLVCGVVCV